VLAGSELSLRCSIGIEKQVPSCGDYWMEPRLVSATTPISGESGETFNECRGRAGADVYGYDEVTQELKRRRDSSRREFPS
jgi:hypothetical protein